MSPEEINILFSFSVEDWQDWIEDILTVGFAKPINKVSEDDIFCDMPDVLFDNNIPPKNFEIAMCKTADRLYVLINAEDKLYRILNALILLKSQRTKKFFFQMFLNNSYSDEEFHFNVKMKALQALYRLDLSTVEIKKIQDYFYLNNLNLYKLKPEFFGNYLRFFRLKKNSTNFYSGLTYIISNLQSNNFEKDIEENIAFTISEKIEEFYFHDPSNFYSSAFNWVTRVNNEVLSNQLFTKIINYLFEFLNDPEIISQLKQTHSVESKCGKVLFLLSICISEVKPLDEFELAFWIDGMNYIIKKNGYPFLKNIFNGHHKFISTTLTLYEETQEVLYIKNDNEIESQNINETLFSLLNSVTNLTFVPQNVDKYIYEEICYAEMNKTLKFAF